MERRGLRESAAPKVPTAGRVAQPAPTQVEPTVQTLRPPQAARAVRVGIPPVGASVGAVATPAAARQQSSQMPETIVPLQIPEHSEEKGVSGETVRTWVTVREAIDGALRTRIVERTIDSGPWPSDFGGSKQVKLRRATTVVTPPPAVPTRAPGVVVAESELRPNQLQDLADQIGDLSIAAIGVELKLKIRAELSGKTKPTPEMIAAINEKLGAVASGLKLS